MRLLAGGATAPLVSRVYPAVEPSNRNLLLVFQASGAWDIASFCDPKENSEARQKITKWSDSSSIQMAGNIPYAPFSKNAEFFEKHHKNIADVSILSHFKNEPNRMAYTTFEWEDFYIDISKNRIDNETLSLLIDLSKDCDLEDAISKQFSGDVINETEKRAVLHID